MSQSVACALEAIDREGTRETRVFIRHIDKFFDCLNVRRPQQALHQWKPDVAPYSAVSDDRFKVATYSEAGRMHCVCSLLVVTV